MNAADLAHVPRIVRLGLLWLTLAAAAGCGALAVWFAVMRPDAGMAGPFLAAAQSALTAAVIVALVSYSFRLRSPADLQAMLDAYLIGDILPALRHVEEDMPPMTAVQAQGRAALRQARRAVPLTGVASNFARGREGGMIRLTLHRGGTLDMYLKVNVGHATVKYFLPPALLGDTPTPEAMRARFPAWTDGLKANGYDLGVARRFHPGLNREVLEVTCYLDLGNGFLADPAQKLFFRNDLRVMTASVLHSVLSTEQGALA